MNTELARVVEDIVTSKGVDRNVAIQAISYYMAPERVNTYHNIKHIHYCLMLVLNQNPQLLSPEICEAILFHDIVMGDNAEEQSAFLYTKMCKDAKPSVFRAILNISKSVLTRDYFLGCSNSETSYEHIVTVLNYVDLAGLWEESSVFLENESRIAVDYKLDFMKEHREKRIAFLHAILSDVSAVISKYRLTKDQGIRLQRNLRGAALFWDF